MFQLKLCDQNFIFGHYNFLEQLLVNLSNFFMLNYVFLSFLLLLSNVIRFLLNKNGNL